MSALAVIGAAATPEPRIHLQPATVAILGKPGEASTRELTFKRRRARHGSTPSRLEFTDEADQPVFLTDKELAFLQREGRFRVVLAADGSLVRPPRSLLDLDEDEVAECERKKAYVDAHLAQCGHGVDCYRRQLYVMDAVREVAAVRDEWVKGDGQAAEHGAAGRRKAPGYTTVLAWLDIWEDHGHEGVACFARKVTDVSHKPPTKIEEAVRTGVSMVIGVGEGTAALARDFAENWLSETGHPDQKLPHVRTFQRRISDVNRWLRACRQFGPRLAGRLFDGSYETRRPELPLEEVEVDHTLLDLLVVDDGRTMILGRPDVIGFRDRCTGSVLGMSIGFEVPSYASFLDGLRHAIYPKDMTAFPSVTNDWYCWGRFRRLYVDNAMHFIGLNIRRAGVELGFEVAELPPGTPMMKGAQERLLGILGMQVHRLPGTTFSNALARRDRAEMAKMPVLTLTELREFLTRWVCDEYNVDAHEGLGFMRTLKGIPQLLWQQGVEQVAIAPLPHEDRFVALAGDVHYRAVNDKGLRLDHIRYQSAELQTLRQDGRHRDGLEDGLFDGTRLHGSRYRVSRDPFDLSHVWVRNPYLPGTPSMRVPAVRQDYARGLTLHRHNVHIANADRDLLESLEEREDELKRARLRVAGLIADVLDLRKEQDVHRQLARYLYKGMRRELRSIVTARAVDAAASAETLLLTAGAAAPPVEGRAGVRKGGVRSRGGIAGKDDDAAHRNVQPDASATHDAAEAGAPATGPLPYREDIPTATGVPPGSGERRGGSDHRVAASPAASSKAFDAEAFAVAFADDPEWRDT